MGIRGFPVLSSTIGGYAFFTVDIDGSRSNSPKVSVISADALVRDNVRVW